MSQQVDQKVRNTLMSAPLYQALEGPNSVRQQRHEVGDHCVDDAMVGGKISTARLEPVCGQALRHCLLVRYVRSLSDYMHDTAIRHIPGRDACSLCAKAEVSLLEIQEIGLVKAANAIEYAPADHH